MNSVNFKNPIFQQYALELLIPFLGYFFFDWSLPVIGFFYLFDFLGSIFSFNYRLVLAGKHQQAKWVHFLLIGNLFSSLSLVGSAYLTYSFFQVNEYLYEGVLNKILEEFLINECWLIGPLVIGVYYMKDQFAFKMPRKFVTYKMKVNVFFYGIQFMTIAILILLGDMLFSQVIFTRFWLLLVIFVAIKITFDFTFFKLKQKYITS